MYALSAVCTLVQSDSEKELQVGMVAFDIATIISLACRPDVNVRFAQRTINGHSIIILVFVFLLAGTFFNPKEF